MTSPKPLIGHLVKHIPCCQREPVLLRAAARAGPEPGGPGAARHQPRQGDCPGERGYICLMMSLGPYVLSVALLSSNSLSQGEYKFFFQ